MIFEERDEDAGNNKHNCQTSKALMKNRKIYLMPKSSVTLTQSGLLAALLQRQRQRGIELAKRRTRRATAGRLFRRGFGGTVPRHT
jgi:hypothetical protein